MECAYKLVDLMKAVELDSVTRNRIREDTMNISVSLSWGSLR